MAKRVEMDNKAGDGKKLFKHDDGYVTQLPDGSLICPQGYELVKSDENEYRCTGGAHRYYFDDGRVEQDKFGNTVFTKNSLSPIGKPGKEPKVD